MGCDLGESWGLEPDLDFAAEERRRRPYFAAASRTWPEPPFARRARPFAVKESPRNAAIRYVHDDDNNGPTSVEPQPNR